jgi:hypothetical protein
VAEMSLQINFNESISSHSELYSYTYKFILIVILSINPKQTLSF